MAVHRTEIGLGHSAGGIHQTICHSELTQINMLSSVET